MKSDEILDSYTELITRYAQVAMKKLKKPTKVSLNDLKQEGAVVFFLSKKLYKKDRGASFKTFLTRCLQNHFADLVKKTYRNMEINNLSFQDDFHDELNYVVDTFEIVQLSFIIEDFSSDELNYINAVLSFTHKHRRSRRKAAREFLGISYEREQELRRSLKDKIRK